MKGVFSSQESNSMLNSINSDNSMFL